MAEYYQCITESFWRITCIWECDRSIHISSQVLHHLHCMALHTAMWQHLWRTLFMQ